ncbi:MAG: ThiF family adenylyltransferase [Firmicutes bacterium]|nr:ThiF family adenylyltransferase [Bacillota bacterium]
MKETQYERTNLLIGEAAVEVLKKSKVAVFGLGGVGGMVVESLARIGVGEFLLIDGDVVSLSNLNRQVIATQNNVGRKKTGVMRERVLSINPNIKVDILDIFVLEENIDTIDLSSMNYVVDAIDTITSKLAIAAKCFKENINLISSMGAGNRTSMDFKVSDIFESSICPIAKLMRRRLRQRGVDKLKVVYSLEVPKGHFNEYDNDNSSDGDALDCRLIGDVDTKILDGKRKRVRKTIGSIPFAPMCAGLYLASEVVKDLIK